MTERERKAKRKPSSDPSTNVPLNPPDPPLEQKLRELRGDRAPDQQAAYFDTSEVDNLGEISDTEIREGELEAGVNDDLPGDDESLDMLTELELRAEETDDPLEAIEEGLTYVPPIDPPTVPTVSRQDGDARFASGYSVSSLDEPYDEDHHSSFFPDDDEMSARVREALLADSSTTQYADRIGISTRGSVVTLRGEVDDLVDSDNLLAVAAYVEGVTEVVDELRVRSIK
jgi:hypothetical protein